MVDFLTAVPTKTEGSIGQPKQDVPNPRTPYNPKFDQNAPTMEQLKTALIQVCNTAGPLAGSVVGSLRNLAVRNFVNVIDPLYGAVGDNTHDDTAAIQDACNAAFNNGVGGTVYFPPGIYKTTAPIVIPWYVSIQGGGSGSIVVGHHSGHIFTSTGVPNGSTAIFLYMSDMVLVKAQGYEGTGAGLAQVAGSYVFVDRVVCADLAYGIVFDQTEIAAINYCNFGACGRGIWFVNGGEFTPGNIGGATNNIQVNGCQFNACGWGIVDDGGALHFFRVGNFNACTTGGIYLAGVDTCEVMGMELETLPPAIEFHYLTCSGDSGPGQCIGVDVRLNFCNGYGGIPIVIVTGSSLSIRNNIFSGCNPVAVTGAQNCARLDEFANFADGFTVLNLHPVSGNCESWVGQPAQFPTDYVTSAYLNAHVTYNP